MGYRTCAGKCCKHFCCGSRIFNGMNSLGSTAQSHKRSIIWAGLPIFILIVGLACRLLPTGESSVTQAEDSPALVSETLQFDGVEREVLLYIPFPLPAKDVPVIFMLHGGEGTAERVMEKTTESRWNELALRDKFIVVYPQGMNEHWNDCRSDFAEPPTDQDDVGFILYFLDWLKERYPVDSEQIFAAGHSNGGMMALRLALEAPETFAAVFSNSGLMAAQSECALPEKSVPVMLMAGNEDPIMPYAGGAVGLGGERLGTVLSAEATLEIWLRINTIRGDPVVQDLPDSSPEDGSTVTQMVYEGGSADVWFYRVNGGGHAWPGKEPFSILGQQINGHKNHDVNAADLAWAFFQKSVE